MSIIKSQELSLSELIDQSNLVVEVEFIEKFEEEIPLVNRETKVPVPSFIKKGGIFRVKKVLKNTGHAEVPEKINVPEDKWRRSLSQHKELHLDGPSKSFTVQEYVSEVKSINKASILFLHYFQGMYELTARGAFENAASEEKITMILAEEKA